MVVGEGRCWVKVEGWKWMNERGVLGESEGLHKHAYPDFFGGNYPDYTETPVNRA
jgi:hypothetical protein